MAFGPDDKLDTGMKVGEAISLASAWWNKTGRHALPKNFNQEQTVKVRSSFADFPAVIIRDEETVVPAGILNGVSWDDLTKDEKRQVVRVYHHWHVRVPNRDRPKATKTDQVLTIHCDHPDHDDEATRSSLYRGPDQMNVYKQAKAEGWLITSTLDYCPACHALHRAGKGEA